MRTFLKLTAGLIIALGLFVVFAISQPMTASKVLWPVLESVMLNEPFVGITANGEVETGLFTIETTGVSTQPVVDAAIAFIDTLDAEQQQRVAFPVDDLEWRRWANVHISTRQGVGFLEFNPSQTEAAFGLIAAGLSARGLQTARDIMRLEGHLSDLMDNTTEYGEKRYWLTIMGEPSTTRPWGWQLDGHHLIINFFVLGDQVVMTPVFLGSEPPRADSGRYAGVSILEEELAAGLQLINALNPEQRKQAILSADKTGNNNHGELFSDNAVVPYQGLPLNALDDRQKQLAVDLIGLYIGNMRDAHAQVKMTEIIRHWDRTYFAWVGATDEDAVFYYRLHSPVVMIEYDHQKPIALDGPAVPSRNHVHTTIRTPNGNDYGKDLLRQHLLTVEH
jgi:hypothetical protein